MNCSLDVTIRLVAQGLERRLDVAVSSPLDVPARLAGAAIAEAFGLDPAACSVVHDGSGREFGDEPFGSLRLRQGDSVTIVERASAAAAAAALATLEVMEPDRASRKVPLAAGTHLIGRNSARATIPMREATVSGIHLQLEVSSGGVVATDLGSMNGTEVDGELLVAKRPTPLTLPSELLLGNATLRLTSASLGRHRRPGPSAQSDAPTPAGEVLFNRPPRQARPSLAEAVTVPAPPAEPQKGRIPLATSVVPLLLTGALFLVAPNSPPTFLLFALMSPAIAIASFWEDRTHGGRSYRRQSASFKQTVEKAATRLADLRRREVARLHELSPDRATLEGWIRDAAPRLWERRPSDPDFLCLAVGSGRSSDGPAASVADGGAEELRAWAAERLARDASLDGVPVGVDLRPGAVGLVGSREETEPLARWLLVEAAALHSPRDVAVAAAVSEQATATWESLKWLPHTRRENSPLRGTPLAGPAHVTALVSDLRHLLSERAPSNAYGGVEKRPKRPWLVVLVDGRAAIDRAAIEPVLTAGPEAGITAIWIAERAEDLPGDCRTVVEVAAGRATIRGASGHTETATLEAHPTVDELRDLAIALAPLRDVTAEQAAGGLPAELGLLEALDAPAGSIDDWVARSWVAPRDSLGVPVGSLGSGPLVLDIERHGPHGLVAGTTGAGKSELLQTIVGAMAAVHSPRRVTFLLIDYKGGTAFLDCRDLPHTVGYVTDLSPSLTARALVSLNAEIRRREHLLSSSGAKDLRGLRAARPDLAPPSLCIVVDEYAALLKELPDFVSGLVDVAQRGRALGIHLILGTQSPSGTVGQAIQANIGFRIALRTANADESNAVVGSDVAATISPDVPGRAYIRMPSGELQLFQAAYANARRVADATSSVSAVEFTFAGGHRPGRRHGTTDGATDLAVVAEAAKRTFDASGEPLPHKPWLAPLPGAVTLADLEALSGGSAAGVPFGLVDEPEHQRQTVATFDADASGGLIVYGAPGSGKTTLLRSVAVGLARQDDSRPLRIYGLDFGAGALRVLEALPQCGSVIAGDDLERGIRLLRLIRREIEARKSTGADGRTVFISRDTSSAGAFDRIVVVIDGYEGFTSTYERLAFGEWTEALPRLVLDGRAVGIHFLVSAGRRFALPSSVVGALETRVILRQGEADDYLQLGLHLNTRQIPDLPPGRGFVETGSLIQCATAGGVDETGQAGEIRRIASEMATSGVGRTPAIGRLPARVDLARLPERLDDGAFVAGIGDEALAPFGLRPDDGHLLVAGPGRSGRTSALMTLAAAIRRSGAAAELHLLSPRDTAGEGVGDLFDEVVSGCEAATDYLFARRWEQAAGERRVVVMIDDCEEVLDPLGAPEFVQLARRRPAPSGPWFVVAMESEAARRAYTEGLTVLRRHRHGLLLTPDIDMDGELFGIRLPRFSAVPPAPGRGYLVRREHLELVQLARG